MAGDFFVLVACRQRKMGNIDNWQEKQMQERQTGKQGNRQVQTNKQANTEASRQANKTTGWPA